MNKEQFYAVLDRVLYATQNQECFDIKTATHELNVKNLDLFNNIKMNPSEIEILNYEQISFNRIHILNHHQDSINHCETLSFTFTHNEMHYLISSIQEDNYYYSQAVKASNYTSLKEKLDILKDELTHLQKASNYLTPYLEKERLEYKMADFHSRRQMKTESKLKI